MTGREGLRDRWRTEVFKSSRLTDGVRIVLLALADEMTDAGAVSVPRSKIAAALNKSPKRITERIQVAREAGFLQIVREGKPGQTAAYIAVIPLGAADRTNDGAVSRTTYGAPDRTKPIWPNRTPLGAAAQDPNTRVTYVTENPKTKSAPTSRPDHSEPDLRLTNDCCRRAFIFKSICHLHNQNFEIEKSA